jgi:hypothetical protein
MDTWTRLRPWLVGLVAMVGMLGCDTGTRDVQPPAQVTRSGMLTEHVPTPLPPDAPRRSVGESCLEHGESECSSGLCIHVGGRGQGYFCSRSCRELSDCPRGWRCLTSLDSRFCVPPRGWAGEPTPL